MTPKRTPGQAGATLVFDRRILLLVEGPDDQAFAAKQVSLGPEADSWHIHFMVGKDSDWVSLIEIALDGDWFSQHGTAVGLILDADSDAAAASDKARGILSRAGLAVPTGHAATATSGTFRTGFFITPDGASEGALEELLLSAVDSSRRDQAVDYIDRVTTEFGVPTHALKAVLQAYFAGQRQHVKSIPVAVEKNDVINANHPAFDAFRQFSRDLEAAP